MCIYIVNLVRHMAVSVTRPNRQTHMLIVFNVRMLWRCRHFYRHTYGAELVVSFVWSSAVRAHTISHTRDIMHSATICAFVSLALCAIVGSDEVVVFPGATNAAIVAEDSGSKLRLPTPSDGCGLFKTYPRLKTIYLARSGVGKCFVIYGLQISVIYKILEWYLYRLYEYTTHFV